MNFDLVVAVLPWVMTGVWFVYAEITFVNLLLADRLERFDGATAGLRSLSILIPARNEAENLSIGLPLWAKSIREFQRLHPGVSCELLVFDDRSDDGTAGVARKALAGFPGRARMISGAEDPPEGWVGKNWACHRLMQEAEGEWLLFADADVRPGETAIVRTLAAAARLGADAVSALPRQELESPAERAVVPWIMHVSILSLLPLPLVRRTSFSSLSVINGQWLLVGRGALARAGGHEGVRGSVLEDVELGRKLKASGARVAPVLAAQDISVRMYRGWRDLRHGYGKNLYPLAGGSWGTVMLLCIAIGFSFWGPFVLKSVPLIVFSLTVLSFQLRLFGASTLLLAPMLTLGIPLLILLFLESTWRHLARKVEWKGRVIR